MILTETNLFLSLVRKIIFELETEWCTIYQYYSICEVNYCVMGEDVGQSQASAKRFPLFFLL